MFSEEVAPSGDEQSNREATKRIIKFCKKVIASKTQIPREEESRRDKNFDAKNKS